MSEPDRIWIIGMGEYSGVQLNSDEPEYTRSEHIPALIEAAVAAERERCAKIADDMPLNYPNGAPPAYVAATWDIAAAIRGETT